MQVRKIQFCPEIAQQELDSRFFRPVEAATFPKHQIRYCNYEAAATIGLDQRWLWISHFGQFRPLAGSFQTPLALCYHGHQFGHYNPDLGDGRGFLFAQMRDQSGRLLDLVRRGLAKHHFLGLRTDG